MLFHVPNAVTIKTQYFTIKLIKMYDVLFLKHTATISLKVID